MSYGDGSIKEVLRRDGKSFNPKHWRVCLSYNVPTLQEDGTIKSKRKKIQRVVEGTKAQAKEFRDQLAAEHDENGRLLSEVEQQREEAKKVDGMTLTKLIDIWDAARHTAGKASARTMREDRRRLAHVEKHMGETPIAQINAQMVESTYAAIREERNLSSTTMRHLHTLLKNVFQKAIDYDMLHKNPCNYVDTPKRNDPKRKSLSAQEGARLLQVIDQAEKNEYAALASKEQRREGRKNARKRAEIRGIHQLGYIMAVRLGLATGMRRGEVIALSWENVNLGQATIRVCKSATSEGAIKATKTQAGVRNVAIDAATVEHLALWKKSQEEQLAKIGVTQTNETAVCCTDLGTFSRVDNFEHWWGLWRKENGFDGLKFHELRHTQATMLLANGVDVKTVQTRMGHANASITLGWYAHAIPQNDHDAAQMLGTLFSANNEEKNENVPENEAISESLRMSPQCPRNGDFGASKKQASNFELVS